MGGFEELNTAGLRAIGLKPEWSDQDLSAAEQTAGTNGAPSSDNDGVPLVGSSRAMVQVNARESVHVREGRVTIGVADLTTTIYTVTIDGTAVVFDASLETPADLAALVAGIAAKIEADVTATLVVDAVADPNDVNSVLIIGKAEADWSLDATVSGGSGTLAGVTAAATGFALRVYTTPGGTIASSPSTNTGNPNGWVLPLDSSFAGLTFRGFLERFDVAGLDRLYVEAHTLTKDGSDGSVVEATIAKIMIGPAL